MLRIMQIILKNIKQLHKIYIEKINSNLVIYQNILQH